MLGEEKEPRPSPTYDRQGENRAESSWETSWLFFHNGTETSYHSYLLCFLSLFKRGQNTDLKFIFRLVKKTKQTNIKTSTSVWTFCSWLVALFSKVVRPSGGWGLAGGSGPLRAWPWGYKLASLPIGSPIHECGCTVWPSGFLFLQTCLLCHAAAYHSLNCFFSGTLSQQWVKWSDNVHSYKKRIRDVLCVSISLLQAMWPRNPFSLIVRDICYLWGFQSLRGGKRSGLCILFLLPGKPEHRNQSRIC